MKLSQKNLEDNLAEKKLLIENLKELLITDDSINNKYTKFKKLQNLWFKIGSVPRSQNSIIWNNFQHHIKNFYDYLHLNRKFKEIDLEHNLNEKEKIILSAKKLVTSNDQYKAFRDFERLKKRWKFELGPVKKEKIENLEKELKNVEEKLNNKRKEFELNKDTILVSNFNTKEELIKEIEGLYQTDSKSIKEWQEKIKTFEVIKKNIEDTGPIPRKLKKSFWNNYKKVVRNFYSTKNIFFKKIKKVYSENLDKQNSLINEIIKISTKDDLEKERQNVISIQKQWKLIKPVPYKANEKNWKNFKNSCDMFFQKISRNKNLKTKENKESELKQNKLIEDVEKFSGEIVELEKIFEEFFLNSKISSEKEKIFLNKIKTYFIKQGLKKEESQNKLNEMKSKFMSHDQKKSEVYKINLILDKLNKDLTQQENNLLFFNDKSKENKLLKKVHLKIKNQKLEIEKLIFEKNKLLK